MERMIEDRLDAIEAALTAQARRYMTTDEAAERCRVSASTFERLRSQGDGPRFARIGGEGHRRRMRAHDGTVRCNC